jgi:hypothetical protein
MVVDAPQFVAPASPRGTSLELLQWRNPSPRNTTNDAARETRCRTMRGTRVQQPARQFDVPSRLARNPQRGVPRWATRDAAVATNTDYWYTRT